MAKRSNRIGRRSGQLLEALEARRLLSTIAWTNRDISSGPNDNRFDEVFGTGNERLQAMQVVDAAISFWERTIVNFNYPGGGNTFNLTLSMNAAAMPGPFIGANSNMQIVGGKAVSGTVGLGWINQPMNGNNLRGWYADPSAYESTEFGAPLNGFAAPPGASVSGMDLFTTVAHEVGHCMGLCQNVITQAFATDTGIVDNINTPASTPASRFWRFDSANVHALFTAWDSGGAGGGPANTNGAQHFAPQNAQVNQAGRWYFGAPALMNAVNNNSNRYIPSDVDALLLQDAFGYTIARPSTMPNMYNRLLADGTLLIYGSPANDSFSITKPDASTIRVTMQLGAFSAAVDGNGSFTANHTASSVQRIVFNAGGGSDSFNIQSTPGITSLTINGTNNADNINIDYLGANMPMLRVLANGGNDVVTLGTGAVDIVTINSPVTVSGGDGADILNIGSGNADAVVDGAISFDGGLDFDTDTLQFNDANVIYDVEYDVRSSSVIRDGLFFPYTVSFLNINEIKLECGSGNDTVTIRNSVGPLVRAFGNAGHDTFVVGDGLLQGAPGHTLNGGSGTNNITFDDRNDSVNRTWQIFPDRVNFAGIFLSTIGFQSVSVLAGNGNDTIVFVTATYDQEITIDAGGGLDQVYVTGAEITKLTVRGGTDSVLDFLEIDDRNFPGNVVGGSVFADRMSRDIFPQTSDVFYSGFASVNWYQQPNQNVISVFGVSSDIAPNYLFSIIGNTLDDLVDVYARDAQGNQTINGNLYFSGGGGPDLLTVHSGSVAANYRFHNQFGGSTTYMGGAGTGWIAVVPNVENVVINGSSANDTFSVEQFTSGSALRINGGGGDDACTIGNGDMSANLTNAAAFTFDGQSGADRFTIANEMTTTHWEYFTGNGFVRASRPGTGYLWHSVTTNIESQYFFAGSEGDAFYLDVVSPGVYTECNGFGGIDGLGFGFATNNLDTVRGPVVYNPGADGGNMAAYDNADTTGDIVHLTATTLGAFAGDTLFGPGGSLTFNNIVNFGAFPGITLGLGSGADTIYAQPLATARVEINGNLPFAAPGDQLNLALAGVQNPVVVHGTNGSVSSSNRQTLSWTGMEQATQPIDNVAPAMIAADINLNGIPAVGDSGRRQAVSVRFSENVSGRLNTSWLQLTNLTTNQQVPTANIAVEYESATNTAHFTFPGYPLGVLPDGDYSGKILAGLPDFFGNGLPADAPFSFFFLQADANHDRRVNLQDFNRLAGNFGMTSGATFSQGDFNYDGQVSLADFNILAGKFGAALAPSAPSSLFGENEITDSERPDGSLRELLN